MKRSLNVLDLFSGIGGFSLGLEKAGCKTIAFAENNPYCQQVLHKHWPGIDIFENVKGIHRWEFPYARPDIICGGFPCQDISLAGAGAGLGGERSGLWFEFLRIIGEFRPRYAIIENVSALRSRGLEIVLGGLASIGYDAEWNCIPAAAVGAPHRRDRIWIVAYPNGQPEREPNHAAGSIEQGRHARLDVGGGGPRQLVAGTVSRMAYPNGDDGRSRGQGRLAPGSAGEPEPERALRHTDGSGLAIGESQRGYPRPKLQAIVRADWWLVEPDVGRVANGIPARVDRLRALGNSIVPEIAYQIGRAIMEAEDAAP